MPTTHVIVAFNAMNNQWGTVYHRSGCAVLARTLGFKEVKIEAAEDRGRGPCAFCHKTSTKRWLCPGGHGPMKLALRMVRGFRGIHLCLECPECKTKIVQAEEEEKHGATK